MVDVTEYSQIAAHVYPAKDEQNRYPLPPGWLEGEWFPDNPIGFSAGWYRKGDEIVISITGTNQTLDWFLTNLGAGIGLITPQLMQAALLYKRIERENPGAQISFTGHSLGGGIASVLAVWFNREATIFAPAPFENAAFNATLLRDISSAFQGRGWGVDASLEAFRLNMSGLFPAREAQVSAYAINGEILSSLFYNSSLIPTVAGNWNWLSVGNSPLKNTAGGQTDLHWMVLHSAMLTSPDFAKALVDLPRALPLVVDEDLYGQPTSSDKRNLLVHILRHQLGYRDPRSGAEIIAPDGMLDRFVEDLKVLAGRGMDAGQEAIQDGLIALAMQYYHEIDGISKTLNGSFLNSVQGGVSFDLSRLSDANLQKILGYQKFLAPVVNRELYGVANGVRAEIGGYRQGTVQIGADALQASGSDQYGDLMLGGAQSDALSGRGGNDLLIGLAGDDTLAGGSGADVLVGGEGLDTYLYNPGEGRDEVVDTDRSGVLKVADTILRGGVGQPMQNHWVDTESGVKYEFTPEGGARVGTLRIYGDALGGPGNEILIRNYTLPPPGTEGGFGLTFERKPKVELLKGTVSANPYADYEHQAEQGVLADLTEGLARSFTLALSAASDAVQTIKLSLGALADKFKAVLGDDVVSFAGGEVQITLQPGQTLASFALIASGDIDDAADIELTATLVQDNPQADAASHSLTVNLDAEEEPDWEGDAFDRTIMGDLAPIDFDPDAPGVQARADELGNLITDQPEPGRADTLYDSAGADRIEAGDGDDSLFAYRGGNDLLDGGGGDDEIDAGAGDDRVLGGAGRDILRGQAGDDRLEGGEEADFLYGWEGDDKLMAEADTTLEEALAQGESGPGSTDRGDFLQGNEGRDTVIGGTAKGLLSGGAGEDILAGGAGDDLLTGDDEYSATGYDWSVARTVETDADGGKTYRYTVNGASGSGPAGAGDALYGGAGADWLFGNEGDDFIDGGADDNRTVARFVPGKSQSARYGDESQSPPYGGTSAANDCEWRRVA
jgi:Ca2+-binding RTX toxin-like protein